MGKIHSNENEFFFQIYVCISKLRELIDEKMPWAGKSNLSKQSLCFRYSDENSFKIYTYVTILNWYLQYPIFYS